MPDRAGFQPGDAVSLILHVQRTIGNQAVQRLLEPAAVPAGNPAHVFGHLSVHPPGPEPIRLKSAVDTPGDRYEREADHISDQVLDRPEPHPEHACTCGGKCTDRRCSASGKGQATTLPIVHQLWSSPGQPLDPTTRAVMERRFGHDFSQVRVHTDARASESAKAIRARAYTAGRDVVFAAGQFSPDTPKGNKLLAHELGHVVQQCNGAPVIQRAPEGDDDQDDEPVVKGPRLLPTQAELNEEAAWLGAKQARRRKFWNFWGDIEGTIIGDAFITSDVGRKALADLDLVFTHEKPVRDPSVDRLEKPVMDNAEAKRIYNEAFYEVARRWS